MWYYLLACHLIAIGMTVDAIIRYLSKLLQVLKLIVQIMMHCEVCTHVHDHRRAHILI